MQVLGCTLVLAKLSVDISLKNAVRAVLGVHFSPWCCHLSKHTSPSPDALESV